MKGEKLNNLKSQEVKPVEAERREQGLRFLARMIARVYACDIKVVRKTDREPNSPIAAGGHRPAVRESPTQESGSPGESEEKEMNPEPVERRPGRPRAVPEGLIPKVFSLYHEGLGYRAVARELREEGISVDWSTIRRIVKGRTGLGDPRQ